MAEKRMISKVISISKKFNIGLSDHFSRLLYVLLIPHSDDFGRLTGDPFKIKALILPMMEDATWIDVESSLGRLHNADLIVWYESSGEKYIQIINFDKHQTGLHKRTKSKFPDPPVHSGKFPEIPPEQNRTELNGTEEKGTEQNGVCDDSIEQIQTWLKRYNVSCRGVYELEQAASFLGTMEIEVIEHCIKQAEGKHVPYLLTILQRHLKEGKTTKESIVTVRQGNGQQEAEIQQRLADERRNNIVPLDLKPDPILDKAAGFND